MGLPASKIIQIRRFQRVQIGYTVPITTKYQHKKATVFKSCHLLFVYLRTKAVHLVEVSEFITKVFIMTLKRFVSRLGYHWTFTQTLIETSLVLLLT